MCVARCISDSSSRWFVLVCTVRGLASLCSPAKGLAGFVVVTSPLVLCLARLASLSLFARLFLPLQCSARFACLGEFASLCLVLHCFARWG